MDDLPDHFGDYEKDGPLWITAIATDFYPDYLEGAQALYGPHLERFGALLNGADDSEHLFRLICAEMNSGRIQLCRIFRKYVCPEAPVELLKKKTKVDEICAGYRDRFRDVATVREHWHSRADDDETLAALLWEYKDRGKKGYELTGAFFADFRNRFGDDYELDGPEGAGRDIEMRTVFEGYGDARPVDFIIRRKSDGEVLVAGFARYDSDRGGAQEDDRTGGYKTAVDEILRFGKQEGYRMKVMFVNDGPGLTLGTMWNDYHQLETRHPGKVLVVTLKMMESRFTEAWFREWLES